MKIIVKILLSVFMGFWLGLLVTSLMSRFFPQPSVIEEMGYYIAKLRAIQFAIFLFSSFFIYKFIFKDRWKEK